MREQGKIGTRIMRRLLTLTTSLAATTGFVAAACGMAHAADGVKLATGGFFNQAFQQIAIDSRGPGDGGRNLNVIVDTAESRPGAWTGQIASVPGNADANRSVSQTGIALGIGDDSAGAGFENFENYASVSRVDGFVTGGGVAYELERWACDLPYSYGNLDITAHDAADDAHFADSGDNFMMTRLVTTPDYALGLGINLEGASSYSSTNADGNGDLDQAKRFEAFEIGIGTAITF